MRKRFWCAIAAALMLAGGAQAQVPDYVPFVAPAPEGLNPAIGPTTPSEPGKGVLAPIVEYARTFGSSDTQAWVNGDYLFTFLRATKLPPLVTTSPNGVPRTEAGILGDRTALLFGGDQVDNDLRAGFRLATGIWFNKEQSLGIEAGFLMTSSQAANFSAASGNGTILARPFIDANSNTAQAVLVAFPGLANGSINVRASSGNLYGANLDLAEKAYDTDWFRLYSLIGYRFYQYNEDLRVQQTIVPQPGHALFAAGTQISSTDNFGTRNQFHGVDLGFRSQFVLRENLTLEVLTKVAIGQQHRDVDISGETITTVPGATPSIRPGGVLALSSNSGPTADTDWRAIPEIGFTLSWQVRSYLAVRAGYSFIYFNQIVRAADQVDTTINPNLLPGANAKLGGAAQPAFNINRTDMWMQSLNLGLEFTY